MYTRNRWYVANDEKRLWHHSSSGWQFHTKIPHRLQIERFHAQYQISDMEPDLSQSRCVTTIVCHQHIIVQSGSVISNGQTGQGDQSKWQEFQHSAFSQAWKLEVETIGMEQVVVEAIAQGTALAVSDGSFKEGRGVAAWTIKGPMANNKITGACLVPGTVEDHSAFWSELMGIFGILLTVQYIMMDNDTGQGTIWVCCDGKSALGRAESDYPILITEPHPDPLSAIRKVHDNLKCQVLFQHV